jgi:hypothetical protein
VECWEVLTSFGGGERQCGCRDGVDDVLFELQISRKAVGASEAGVQNSHVININITFTFIT